MCWKLIWNYEKNMGSLIVNRGINVRIFYLSFIIFLLTPVVSFADPVSKKDHYKGEVPAPKVPAKVEEGDLKISGYIDGSYNNLQRNYFTSGSFNRVFDNQENGLTLQQAAITLAYQPKQGFGGLVNPIMGYDTNIFAPYGFKPITEFDSQTFSIDVPQAFLQYTKNSFTVSGGRFVELAGYEALFPTQNTNFSRSILYGFAEPFTVLGLRGTYVVNDKFTFIIGVNNGWDNIRDWSRDKTIEFNASYTPNSCFSFSSTVYTGQERATPQTSTGPEGWRTLIDLIATFNVTEKLSLIANYDGGWQTTATLPNGANNRAVWQGIAGYFNYTFNDHWITSLRGEYFDDQNGYRTGVKQAWKEITLTLGYVPIKNLEIRAESRHDFSNVNSFTTFHGGSTSNNNQSYALEAFYKFG